MKPVIAVICETSQQGPHLYHQVGDKYVQALVRCADVMPVLIPSLHSPIDTAEVLKLADGVFFTGGYSNIQRRHYGLPPAPEGEHEDPARDKNTLALLPAVLSAGLPVLAICRGIQELNVALGGTLHPRLHEIEGHLDHREDTEQPLAVQYGPAHSIAVRKGGLLASIVGHDPFKVNSVHGQGIDKLAPGLSIEATAPDNTIEAVSVDFATAFALAVQWHPEWIAWENPQSQKIFGAFGHAARNYKQHKF